MKHAVKYSLLPGLEKTGILAPMLPITFIHKGNTLPTVGLVDSGAQGALISTVIAEELGIKWEKLPKFVGFTTSGSFTFRVFKDLEVEVFDTKFTIDISIAEGINAFKCVLGRKDIFKKTKITFEGYNNIFYIEFRPMN